MPRSREEINNFFKPNHIFTNNEVKSKTVYCSMTTKNKSNKNNYPNETKYKVSNVLANISDPA